MSTIKQKTAYVALGDGRIEVRRMSWKAAGQFLRILSGAFVPLFQEGKLGDVAFGPDGVRIGGDAVGCVLKLLPELIAQAEELSLHLATSSTDLDAETFNNLDVVTAAEVLAKALALNFDDELKKSLAGVGSVVRTLMPAQVKTS